MIPKKINNDYVALLLHDYIEIKHPQTKKPIRLYRLISTKTFKIDYDISEPLKSEPSYEVIEINTIGGYVESIDNLDPDTYNWISNISKVFDKAYISNGSIIKNNCQIYNNAIISKSRLSNYAKASGNSQIINSLLTDLVEVKDNAKVENSYMHNASIVMENGSINNSKMEVGSIVRGNAVSNNSYLTDIAQIQGDVVINNCNLKERTVLMEGEYYNEDIAVDADLSVIKHVIS